MCNIIFEPMFCFFTIKSINAYLCQLPTAFRHCHVLYHRMSDHRISDHGSDFPLHNSVHTLLQVAELSRRKYVMFWARLKNKGAH